MTGESLPVVLRLREALDRLEAIAKATTCAVPWKAVRVSDLGTDVQGACEGWVTASTQGACAAEDARFIAANDPATVLRTIQAHRKILDRCSQVLSKAPKYVEDWAVDELLAELIMRDLASIYFPESDG